jgi:hypothetical protein
MLGRRWAATTGTPSMTTLPQGTWTPWMATTGTTTTHHVGVSQDLGGPVGLERHGAHCRGEGKTAFDHVEAFLAGVRRVAAPTRVLATVLFTDIVGSTEQANRLGDRRWRELLNVHDEVAQQVSKSSTAN